MEHIQLKNPYPECCTFSFSPICLEYEGIHPAEKTLALTCSSEKRRAEFVTGRRCAHKALKEAGYPFLPILKQSNRSPQWPFNVVGSISHGASLAAALIKRKHKPLSGIGIDIEDLSREIRTNITGHVLTPWEIDHWLKGEAAVSEAVRIIFSIKEAIYKCFYPLEGINLGFFDADVLEFDSCSFKARLLKNPFKGKADIPLALNGTLQITKDVVFAAIKHP